MICNAIKVIALLNFVALIPASEHSEPAQLADENLVANAPRALEPLEELSDSSKRENYVKFCRKLLNDKISHTALHSKYSKYLRQYYGNIVIPQFEAIRAHDRAKLTDPFDIFQKDQVDDILLHHNYRVHWAKRNGQPAPYMTRRAALIRDHCVALSGTEYFHAARIYDRFICSQAPEESEDSERRFWKMIVEEKVQVIVNVLITEHDTYFPVGKAEKFGPFEVERTNVEQIEYKTNWLKGFDVPEAPITITKLSLVVKHDGRSYPVTVYHIPGWVDNATPLNGLAPLPVIQMVGSNARTLVHCAAGLGRSGTYIAISLALEEIFAGKNPDVMDLVIGMRTYRAELVYTADQFVYVYYTILKYAEQIGLFESFGTEELEQWRHFELEFLRRTQLATYRTHADGRARKEKPEPHFADFLLWAEELNLRTKLEKKKEKKVKTDRKQREEL